MFKILGVLLACYVVHCLTTGSVFARSGPWGRRYSRDQHTVGYWGAIGSYAVLALALVFIF